MIVVGKSATMAGGSAESDLNCLTIVSSGALLRLRTHRPPLRRGGARRDPHAPTTYIYITIVLIQMPSQRLFSIVKSPRLATSQLLLSGVWKIIVLLCNMGNFFLIVFVCDITNNYHVYTYYYNNPTEHLIQYNSHSLFNYVNWYSDIMLFYVTGRQFLSYNFKISVCIYDSYTDTMHRFVNQLIVLCWIGSVDVYLNEPL